MNQKSSLRKILQFVSQALTANNATYSMIHRSATVSVCKAGPHPEGSQPAVIVYPPAFTPSRLGGNCVGLDLPQKHQIPKTKSAQSVTHVIALRIDLAANYPIFDDRFRQIRPINQGQLSRNEHGCFLG
jgi:hypothetical protein